jgi:hypothetical protein
MHGQVKSPGQAVVSLEGLAQLDDYVLHVNHACLLIKRGPSYLLCDPWPISPAFGTWTQSPAPPAALIRLILSLDPAQLAVVISHGHDDHLDDFFVGQHLSRCQVFVPEFRSPGLANRIQALTGRPPALLNETPAPWSGFRLSRAVNDDFTGSDAIVAIETDGWSLIHANDNWHRQPREVIDALLQVKRRCAGPFLYLSQIGIADCFPLCYPQYEPGERPQIVAQRIEAALQAARANMAGLRQEQLYVYANQSQVISSYAAGAFSGLDATAALLERSDPSGGAFSQLTPGDLFVMGPDARRGRVGVPDEDLLLHLLGQLEAQANAYLGALPGCSSRPVRFDCLEAGQSPTAHAVDPSGFFAAYAADRITWQNILTGRTTLEAISIGGSGAILKHPRDFNMRDVHNAISKFAYLAQRRALEHGLGWLLDGS